MSCSVAQAILLAMIFSNILERQGRSEMGRYDSGDVGFCFGFGMGMMVASFQACGIWLLLNIVL